MDDVAVAPWFYTADLPTAAQVTDVPQRTGMGTQPCAYAQHYRGHPQPPLFLPGSRPQSRLSSPSCGWHGSACSTHLGVKGYVHHLLGLLSTHRGQDTPGQMAPRAREHRAGLAMGARS